MNSHILFGLISILLLNLTSCEKYDDLVGYREYKIEEGKQSSKGHDIALLGSTVLAADVIFDESAMYNLKNTKDQGDWNKLFGFSDCNDHHHENSARFGWRWYNNELQIATYIYVDGEQIAKKIAVVKLNQSYRYVIQLEKSHYSFEIEGLTPLITTPRGNDCNKGIHYYLYPYFGGTSAAPQDISIFMRLVYN